ncbi:unnamed protein product [Boreogadus saida]
MTHLAGDVDVQEASSCLEAWERMMQGMRSGSTASENPSSEVMSLVTRMYKQTAIAKVTVTIVPILNSGISSSGGNNTSDTATAAAASLVLFPDAKPSVRPPAEAVATAFVLIASSENAPKPNENPLN